MYSISKNQLVQSINKDSVMTVKACLVGSGAKNLVTQNANSPIDLDYNICILDTKSININNGRDIKEYIRKEFNNVLKANDWNEIPDSRWLEEKVYAIKLNHLWGEVRSTYLEKKNLYLQRNDNTHPSFIVYIESVNQVYYKYFKFV